MRAARVLVVAASLGVALGCGMLAGIDSLAVDQCYQDACAADASTDAPFVDAPLVDASTPDGDSSLPLGDSGCPQAGGAMVAIPSSPKFCIDSTEVTFAAYKDFLTAKGSDTSGQIAACKFNTSFTPATIGSGSLPVSGVDWCDAVAFCKWAGKRLCGNVNGGSLPQGSFKDPSKAEWLYACSAGGTQPFSYGSSYVAGNCNTDLDASGPDPVGTRPKCQGGFAGVYDLLGNLWELEDSPDFDAGTAVIIGEGWTTLDPTFRCDSAFTVTLSYQANDVGFRCCSP